MQRVASSSCERWKTAEFLGVAQRWVERTCAELQIVPSGEWEQVHCRPWSSAIRFETDQGRLWFKVNGPGTRHEPALLTLLGELIPDVVPELLASAPDAGFSLARDAGPSLRSLAGANELWSHWEAVVARYAEAQVTLAGHGEALRATGIRQLTCARMPELAHDLSERLARVPVHEGGLSALEHATVSERLDTYAADCAELGRSGVPDSLQHDDLHAANICWPGGDADGASNAGASRARIIDWGDACWGHPFGTLLATLDSIASHAGADSAGDRRVQRVRDAYLEPFTHIASRPALLEAAALARRVGWLTRALAWQAGLLDAPTTAHAEHEFPVRRWLLRILLT